MSKSKKQRHRQPWARAAALIVGCIVTFIGLAQHLDPEVLLFRVLVASTTTAVIIATASACMRGLASKT